MLDLLDVETPMCPKSFDFAMLGLHIHDNKEQNIYKVKDCTVWERIVANSSVRRVQVY